jgi:glycosyltransferase involved in cell wall biosynthesis
MTKIIVLISETFPPDLCGVADYVFIIGKELSKKHEVHILTRKKSKVKHYSMNGLVVHEIMSSKLYILDVIQFLRTINPEIIDVHLSYSSSSKLHKKNIFSLCNSFLLRISFKQSKLFCTVHELTSFLQTDYPLLSIYRKVRDYFHTRFYDYYFCVDKRYLQYFKSETKSFIPHFSNIATLLKRKKITSPSILYFGTISKHKNIDKLMSLIDQISFTKIEIKLVLIGGVIDSYKLEFEKLIVRFSKKNIEYLGFLKEDAIVSIINECNYAIFPFKVSDKNSSILAMLVNGLIVMAEANEDLEFSKYHTNLYTTKELTQEFITSVIDSTLNSEIEPYNNDILVANNIAKRIAIYESILLD